MLRPAVAIRVDHLSNYRGDDCPLALPWTEGVERSQDRYPQAERARISRSHHVGADLRGRIGRLSLQRMALEGDRDAGGARLRRIAAPVIGMVNAVL